MAAITPIANSRFDNVSGSQRQVIAKFASVADTNTWVTGLAVITGVNLTAGNQKVMYASTSGGTVTFNVTAGPDTNTYVDVTGF